MFQARTPGIGPDLLEHFEEPGSRQGPPERRHVLQRVERERFQSDRIKIQKITPALLGNRTQHLLRQVPVRIEQGHALAMRDVLRDKRFEERRFSSAGLADHVHRGSPVSTLDPKSSSLTAKVGSGKKHHVVVLSGRHSCIVPLGK